MALESFHPDWWYEFGKILEKHQHYLDAITAYKQAIKLEPDFEEAWYRVAVSYAACGDKNNCLEYLAEALKLDPDMRKDVVKNFAKFANDEDFQRIIRDTN
ncbi:MULTISPECIES: tetratricopeptide repeat protein [Fischerella]|uniref:Tetratricopeptide repeat protein n=1 Tax=Fischerella muscicola CCMEE 5323 TaxID=2019572 RepID=A0A2N6K5W0_FISMU|nr:tetratricopeptide repeat protein [Fischerella muscicola]PLZ92057.1 tetratricopeptide repeat protein [Fischerella muscicola CCMEE 5323]